MEQFVRVVKAVHADGYYGPCIWLALNLGLFEIDELKALNI